MEEINFNGAIEEIPTGQEALIGSFAPTTRPDTYMVDFAGTIEMQKQTPSCGAHAGQSLKQVLEDFRGSPEYLWKKIRQSDGLSPNEGSNMSTIMKVLQKIGICNFNLLPNNPVNNASYADPSTLTPEMDTDASSHKIDTYAFEFNPTFEQIKQAIYDHKGVVMLLKVGAEWWTKADGSGNSWAEKDILPLRTNVPITSGHFVTAFAYDENYIYFINEWSSAWGRAGIGYFGSDYAPRCVQIGTAVNTTINKYIFTKVLQYGSKGYDVKQLQTKLGIPADGIFGNQTKQAVITFQLLHNLVEDGIVGILTNNLLNQ